MSATAVGTPTTARCRAGAAATTTIGVEPSAASRARIRAEAAGGSSGRVGTTGAGARAEPRISSWVRVKAPARAGIRA